MTLSFIIVNYKSKGLTKQCLRGIFDCQLPFEFEVIVIDNHSQDGCLDMVAEQFPSVIRINSPVNVGFGAGVNLGLRRATGEYLMILNPDVAVFGPAIELLLKYLKKHPEVALVAPKLIHPDGTTQDSCYRFYRWMTPVYRRTVLGRTPTGRHHVERLLMKDWNHQGNRAVGWVLGACMIIPRSTLENIGQFDERFFLYFEDVDWCRRMWQAGQEVHYVADAEMVHYHRRLSADSSGLQSLLSYPTRVHIQSAMKYFAKYYGAAPAPHTI